MKIATIVALLHPFVILVGTALSCYLLAHHPEFVESEGGWLNNPGFHGLSEQFYELLRALPTTAPVSKAWATILISGTMPAVGYLF